MKTKTPRCPKCFIHQHNCICHKFKQFDLPQKVTYITRQKESRIISNTGRCIPKLLSNCQMFFLGDKNWEEEINNIVKDKNYQHLLFFPNPSSPAPNQIYRKISKPLNIIILDTSWSSARRWSRKNVFVNIPKIELKQSWRSHYFLRSAPTDTPNHLCTLESLSSLFKEFNDPNLNPLIQKMDAILKDIVMLLGKERGKTNEFLQGIK